MATRYGIPGADALSLGADDDGPELPLCDCGDRHEPEDTAACKFCPDCNGWGEGWDNGPERQADRCPTCNGSGNRDVTEVIPGNER